ncbi:MAG: hypothetical protein NHB15_17755 [Methanosarcina barkeri]|nr:hypothetical protein [Methanosarcina sp. ERenArc_MAG2]
MLDLTHGGIPIAKKLAAAGNKVIGIDVYGTVDPGLLLELEEKHGIRCSKTPLPASGFDLLVAPVHLDSAYPMLEEARAEEIRVLSHHEIVGKILKDDSRLSGIKTVEITGVKAKTSTSSLLADMLSRRFEVALHTSRGLEYWKGGISSLISSGLSITPGSVLVAVEKVFDAGFRPDFLSSKSPSEAPGLQLSGFSQPFRLTIGLQTILPLQARQNSSLSEMQSPEVPFSLMQEPKMPLKPQKRARQRF